MNPRTFISTTPIGLLAGTGCLAYGGQQVQLGWINLQNHRKDAYDVEVTVEDEGEIVFSTVYHLGTDSETANIFEENPVKGDGMYIVRASLDGELREVDTTEFTEDDETCIGVRFELLDIGSIDYWVKSMQHC